MKDQATDQVLADADQTAANADQRVSSVDQGSADADDTIAALDQRASDNDQTIADKHHDTLAEVTSADQQAYEAARNARAIISAARHENRAKRARTTRDREAAAGQRDRTAAARDTAPDGDPQA